jgi:polyribonucleotide nucleotidyltransferase
MFNIVKKSIQWGEEELTLETGKVARQADGSVIATLGETSVMANVTFAKAPKPGQDFFPLTVHYQEKYYAAGKVPGGFFKREARPTEKETLTARLIDRPCRPLFVPGFKHEVLVMCTVLSHDLVNEPDIVAMIAASAALTISGVPFMGPIAAARVGFADGEYILNPEVDDMQKLRENPEQRLDLVVAGTKDAVMMVESEASELSEEIMLGAVKFGHEQFQSVIDMIIDLAEDAAKEPRDIAELPEGYDGLVEKVAAIGTDALTAAYGHVVKQERSAAVSAAKEEILAKLAEEEIDDALKGKVGSIIKDLEKDIVRGAILKTGKRIDGRTGSDVRPILGEVSILPRSHGSALFTRGETQALAVATLGTGQDEQIVDALDGEYRENFMLHYNFPPYSVGEAGRMGSPGRREIGHGKLAWRALHPLMPTKEQFPYTVRIVSEVTESNGSSSMATVCSSSLAMMDAGVPLARPVAGIAMGLIKEGDEFAVLSDIMGDEDHLGDMDFKVAGTENGVTSLQMDIKINGITDEIMEIALEQAHEARLHILGEMNKVIAESRPELSSRAPSITTIKIHPDKIRDVIGKGGSTIRSICDETGASIDLDDDGNVKIYADNQEAAQAAVNRVKEITAEIEVGAIYKGRVERVVDFGAFVNILPGKDGLVHISQIADHRVENVTDELSEGQEVLVKVLDVDNRGRVKLSMKEVKEGEQPTDFGA